MKLLIISHKRCWVSSQSPSGYATDGGFPFQVDALSRLFDSTVVLLPCFSSRKQSGEIPIIGHNLSIAPLTPLFGSGIWRKLQLPFWFIHNFFAFIKEVIKADVVHTPVPGDIGTIGILVTLLLRKPLFVRHCGTWKKVNTLADRFLFLLLERIAGEYNVVMATGESDSLPSFQNPAISWVFSTTLSEKEISSKPIFKTWTYGDLLKLVTIARLTPAKNVEAVIRALPLVRKVYSEITLDIVGTGICLEPLKKLSEKLNISNIVFFHGNLSHQYVLKILMSSHLFVLPTQVAEGFPKAVLEALACGLPVITTAVSATPYIIGNQRGILLQDTDYKSVAEAIIQLISDEKRFSKMASEAWNISQKYTLEKWQDIIEERLSACWGLLRTKN